VGFSLAPVARQALRPAQPPIQWIPQFFRGDKSWPGRDADHSVPSSAKVKNE
jgi:hypothetical protein